MGRCDCSLSNRGRCRRGWKKAGASGMFSHTPGCTYRGETGDTRLRQLSPLAGEDIELLKSMPAKAYRFSVAWTRIAPTGGTDWNEKGFAYYDGLVNTLLKRASSRILRCYHRFAAGAGKRAAGRMRTPPGRLQSTAKMAEHFKGRVRSGSPSMSLPVS